LRKRDGAAAGCQLNPKFKIKVVSASKNN
jgi:hypothetical protein